MFIGVRALPHPKRRFKEGLCAGVQLVVLAAARGLSVYHIVYGGSNAPRRVPDPSGFWQTASL